MKKIPVILGLGLCLAFYIGWYFLNKFGLWPVIPAEKHVFAFVMKELKNLISILPATWAGAFLCKGDLVNRIFLLYQTKLKSIRMRKLVLALIWVLLFVVMNVIHKAVFTLIFAILSFLLFNIWEKGKIAEKVWMFLGDHSTNIWLTHMFFYATLFAGLAQKAKYPLLILGFLLALCIAASYIEKIIAYLIKRIFKVREVI